MSAPILEATDVVKFLGQGAAQVIDLGAGVPSHPSIHSAARSVNPGTRVVYVDHEAVACYEIQHEIGRASCRERV